jgi:hypothetical protein
VNRRVGVIYARKLQRRDRERNGVSHSAKRSTCVMAYLGVHQARDMKESLAIAKTSAEAAKLQADVAEKSLIGTEAPFLFPVTSFEAPQNEGIASYIFRNYGRGAAILREVYHCTVESASVPDPAPFPPTQTGLYKTEVIGAGHGSTVYRPLPIIEQPNLNKVAAIVLYGRDKAHFIVCQARYTDIFGNQYITNACLALNDQTSSFYPIGGIAHNRRRKLTKEESREAEARDMLPSLTNKNA